MSERKSAETSATVIAIRPDSSLPPETAFNPMVLPGQTVTGKVTATRIDLMPLSPGDYFSQTTKSVCYDFGINSAAVSSMLIIKIAIAFYAFLPIIAAYMTLEFWENEEDSSWIPSREVVYGLSGTFCMMVYASAVLMFLSSCVDGNIVDEAVRIHTQLCTLANTYPQFKFKSLRTPNKNTGISYALLSASMVVFLGAYPILQGASPGLGIMLGSISALLLYGGLAVRVLTVRTLGHAAITIFDSNLIEIKKVTEGHHPQVLDDGTDFKPLEIMTVSCETEINEYRAKLMSLATQTIGATHS